MSKIQVVLVQQWKKHLREGKKKKIHGLYCCVMKFNILRLCCGVE